MDILSTSAQQLTDQAQRFSAFTGLVKSNPQDRFFLVMGKTGSGKSTFVARCTGKAVTVGHGLYSCTSSIDTYSYTLPNPHDSYPTRRIHLIDTPGFNDTTRSDIETLGILASYLGASYANGVRIHGIIMLHSITDNRMGGSSIRNIEMMKKLCGFASYENTAIATTMWPQASSNDPWGASSHDLTPQKQREAELLTDERFLGEFATKGAVIFRHNESGRRDVDEETRSARRIVSHLIAESDTNSKPKVLRLQREIIDEEKTLGETAAGIVIAGDLYKARKEHERQLRDLETELKGQLARTDASHAAELQGLKSEIRKKMAKAKDEKKALQKSMREMHENEEKAWKDKIMALDKQFREQIAHKELELEELEESIQEIREDVSTSTRSARHQKEFAKYEKFVRDAPRDAGRLKRSAESQREFAKHEEIVRIASREVVEARDAHSKLKSNITNGLANGISAGVATSVITGVLAGTLLCTVM